MPNISHEPAVLLLENHSVSNQNIYLIYYICMYKIYTCLAKQLNFDQLQVNVYLALHVKINPRVKHVLSVV